MERAPLGPIAGAYYLDNSRVAVIEGPVGSGKTTASCLRLQRHAYEQAPSPDGCRRTRWGIVRNTKPQLWDTTIKTWEQVFPPELYGPILSDGTQTWKFKPKGHTHSIEAEFIFRALDDAADVRNLLSLEVTGFYFNEVREIAEEIIGHAGRRTRYLGGERPSTWSGWIGDTNPWDTEHYLQDRLVDNPREGWRHFLQPGGMEPDAENLENLEQTEELLLLPYTDPRRREQGRQYYIKALQDYSPEDAAVYVHAQRGRTRDGKPIYTDFSDKHHVAAFELSPMLPLSIGMDFGRTPAAVIAQRSPHGGYRIRHEIVTTDMGLVKFGEQVAQLVKQRYPRMQIEAITGDPAGMARDARDETAFDILKVAAGLAAKPATTNELSVRIESVNSLFRRNDRGVPSIQIHPECKTLRRACIDGYRYRKLKVIGERYSDEPDKNLYSHVAEALQYLVLGGGDAKLVLRGQRSGLARPATRTD
jgi:hypothetical protein